MVVIQTLNTFSLFCSSIANMCIWTVEIIQTGDTSTERDITIAGRRAVTIMETSYTAVCVNIASGSVRESSAMAIQRTLDTSPRGSFTGRGCPRAMNRV